MNIAILLFLFFNNVLYVLLVGIPCSHAISCIWQRQEDPIKYVSDWYKKECYQNTYKYKINPINPTDQWPKTWYTPMEMPPDRVKPGRPKKLRRVEHDEVIPRRGTRMTRRYVTTTCSKCGKTGHNSRTCFRRDQENEVKEQSLSQSCSYTNIFSH